MLKKGGAESVMLDNALGIIHKDLKGETIPDIRGKSNASPLFLNGSGKRIGIRVVNRFTQVRTECGRNIRSLSI